MPYAREHKNKTRARIVDSARVLFNRHGFEAVPIDDVMKGAARPRHRHLRLRKERRRGCQAARRQASGARERHHASDGTDLSLLSRLAIGVFGAFLSRLKADPALLRPDAAVSSSMAKEQFGAWIRGNSIGPSGRSPRNTS